LGVCQVISQKQTAQRCFSSTRLNHAGFYLSIG
jgi:hypothetical protein